jgi:ring-1,2-phenylacetyl-CoA epoxidase subunit PaaB
MSDGDTQWPRFEVFQQVRADTPFHNVGSVHAPDAELALQNARDVFVRRPQTVTMWVVPAAQILTKTREELAAESDWRERIAAPAQADQRYYVFNKSSQRRSMNFVAACGEVEASSPLDALSRAITQYGNEGVYVWWIVPAAAVTSSKPEEVESLFAPAHDKEFRLPGSYHTRTLMDEIRKPESEDGTGS